MRGVDRIIQRPVIGALELDIRQLTGSGQGKLATDPLPLGKEPLESLMR